MNVIRLMLFELSLLLFAASPAVSRAETFASAAGVPRSLLVKLRRTSSRRFALNGDLRAARDRVSRALAKHGRSVTLRSMWRDGYKSRLDRFASTRGRATRAARIRETLSCLHVCTYTGRGDPTDVAALLSALPDVEYCERRPIRRTSFMPDDPLVGTTGQDYFQYQSFDTAWDKTQGSEEVVVAIVDSGVDYTHPDLADKLWINEGEIPDNGLDDDGNGYVDDVMGWDFWQSGPANHLAVADNDPMDDYSGHGTHVAGIAAADTNNGVGIAGTGFNCRYMAVKAGGTEDFPDEIAFGMEGILYAAMQGADIINCSWAGDASSKAEEEIISLATSLGALIICSAGNDGLEERAYPAAYTDAMSVGSLDMADDRLSSFSNFGTWVDVLATGNGIRSTVRGDTYQIQSGTSMSAPVVSGLAGLLKALHSDWPPQRIRGQIRGAAVNVDGVNAARLAYKLGSGRLNAEAAVGIPLPCLSAGDVTLKDDDGVTLFPGDDGFLEAVLTNTGSPVASLSITLVALGKGVTILDDRINLGALLSDASSPVSFPVRLEAVFDAAAPAEFVLTVEDTPGAYDDVLVVAAEPVVSATFSTDKLRMTATSTGTLGFVNALENTGGVGFVARADTESPLPILFEGALLLDVDGVIVDQARETDGISHDFEPLSGFTVTTPGSVSGADGSGRFTVCSELNTPDVEILLETFVFNEADVDQAVWVKYALSNPASHSLHNVYVGLFNDWDIGSVHGNSAAFDPESGILYLFDEGQTDMPYVTVAPMAEVSSLLAIDNAAESGGEGGAFGLYDGFTDAEKAVSLHAGATTVTQSQTDVSAVCASGPYTLPPSGSVVVGFIYAYGDNLADLRAQIAAARAKQVFSTTTPTVAGPSNRAPSVEITEPGDDLVALPNSTSGLVLQAVADDDGEPSTGQLQTLWSVTSGAEGVVFDSTSELTTTVRFPGPGIYTLEIAADDGMMSARDYVLVAVQPDSVFVSDWLAGWSFETLIEDRVPDVSGNDRDAVASGGLSLALQGHTGLAADLNGTTAVATFAAPAVQELTISAWINPRSAGNSVFPRIVDMPAYTFYLGRDPQAPDTNNTLRFHVEGSEGGGVWHTPENTVSEQGWHHVAVAFNTGVADAEPSFFINGVQTAAERLFPISGTVYDNQGSGYIGNRADGDRGWDGLLDDVRIYGRFLSADHVCVLQALPTVNAGPSVAAGPDVEVNLPDTASLTVVVSDDGLPSAPGAVTISWAQLSGPGTVTFAPPDETETEATFSAPGTYVVGVTADDGAITTRDEIIATVVFNPTIGFSQNRIRVLENQGSVTVTVVLNGATDQLVDATIRSSGTASGGGVDVSLSSDTVVFAPGETAQSVSLVIVDDSEIWEGEESLFLTLIEPRNATIGTGTHEVVIVDDDESFELEVTAEGQAGTSLVFGAVTGATDQGEDLFDVAAGPDRDVRGTPVFFREPVLPGGPVRRLATDIREYHELYRWRLATEDVAPDVPVQLNWNFSQLPIPAGRTMVLQLLENERPMGTPIDMLAATTAVLATPAEFSLVYGPLEVEEGVELRAGWNFVGIPLLTKATFSDLFPGHPHTPSVSAVWVYRDGAYQPGHLNDVPNPEWAYWLYAEEAGSGLPFSGVPADGVLCFQTKWEGVSPIVDVATEALSDVFDPIWRWDAVDRLYRSTGPGQFLIPGNAYWIRTPTPGYFLNLVPDSSDRGR